MSGRVSRCLPRVRGARMPKTIDKAERLGQVQDALEKAIAEKAMTWTVHNEGIYEDLYRTPRVPCVEAWHLAGRTREGYFNKVDRIDESKPLPNLSVNQVRDALETLVALLRISVIRKGDQRKTSYYTTLAWGQWREDQLKRGAELQAEYQARWEAVQDFCRGNGFGDVRKENHYSHSPNWKVSLETMEALIRAIKISEGDDK